MQQFKGYTLNRQRIKKNHEEFLNAVEKVKSILPAGDIVSHDSVLELIKLFADTWFSLDAYDKDNLKSIGSTKRKAKLTGEKLASALAALTALTLLIAESNPKDKEKMIGLVCALLR